MCCWFDQTLPDLFLKNTPPKHLSTCSGGVDWSVRFKTCMTYKQPTQTTEDHLSEGHGAAFGYMEKFTSFLWLTVSPKPHA